MTQGPEYVVDLHAGERVRITKDFGPWAVPSIRITLDYDKAAWIIERQNDLTGDFETVYELVVD